MKIIRLAIIFDQPIQSGGGYQQSLNAALLVRDLPGQILDPVFFTTRKDNVSHLAHYGIQARLIRLSFFEHLLTKIRRILPHVLFRNFLVGRYSAFEKLLIRDNIDLVYFLSPFDWARDLGELNFIITVWDLCHRDNPEFPEVRWNRQHEVLDRRYWSLLSRASAIFVDSEIGKKNIVHRYGIDTERVHVMPFQAGVATRQPENLSPQKIIEVRVKYELDVPYVFYPAQFWAHKNHVYLLEGLRNLERRHGLRVGAIFSGGDQGNLSYVKYYVRKLNLEDRVRFVGFIANEEIPDFYAQSVALVMPSYFGPTNLPPLEAFKLGVPVLYPDKPGLRDQVGDAALLIDLRNPFTMADHLKSLLDDERLRLRLIQAGFEHLKSFDFIHRDRILHSVIEEFRWKRLTWR